MRYESYRFVRVIVYNLEQTQFPKFVDKSSATSYIPSPSFSTTHPYPTFTFLIGVSVDHTKFKGLKHSILT